MWSQCFDKVLLLYNGRQIFFGPVGAAKSYFTALGFVCPNRSTTADFLTSVTSSEGHMVLKAYELQAPRTADQFVEIWKKSLEYVKLQKDIDQYEVDFPIGGQQLDAFRSSQKVQKTSYRQFLRSSDLLHLLKDT